ncbi:MAG: DUF4097 domain-containing protein [Ruminococcaceae bacterium]|nr:DUF4097 domain-containing protein [Oscillospiraceae bacterium]
MADKQIYNFTNEIEEVEVSSLGAKITVLSTEDSTITAEYQNPLDKPEFCAVLCGKKLTLKEKCTFNFFRSKAEGEYSITVRLPKTMYKKIKINTASGGVELPDAAVNAEHFELNTASGEININSAFVHAAIKSASGNVNVIGVEGLSPAELKISTVSGTVNVRNYSAEKYSISSVSGKTSYSGATGEGNITVTSGNVEITYAEWNKDLKINAVSGNVNIILPDDSGADVRFDGVSGTVKTNLNNTDGGFMNLGRGTNGEFGGSNKHKVNINLVSGKVTLAKNGSFETVKE